MISLSEAMAFISVAVERSKSLTLTLVMKPVLPIVDSAHRQYHLDESNAVFPQAAVRRSQSLVMNAMTKHEPTRSDSKQCATEGAMYASDVVESRRCMN